MFTVYQILNKVNNKSYIGSSIHVEKRWRQHINCSKNINDPHYTYPLYQAFRKYGLDNFEFNILRDDFENYQEMIDYEHDMILFFNSYNNRI